VDDELGIFDDLLAVLPAYAKLRLDANGAGNRRQAAKGWRAAPNARGIRGATREAPMTKPRCWASRRIFP